MTNLITDQPIELKINEDSYIRINKIEAECKDETPELVERIALDYDVMTKGDDPTDTEIEATLKSFVQNMNDSLNIKYELEKQ